MVAKGKKIFYKIGEVCELCEVEPHVLRYWESEFPILSPAKNRAGQRIYRQKDIQLIEKIKQLLYVEGYTIAGANKKLAEEGYGGQDGLPLFSGSLQVTQRRLLREIRKELEEIKALLDADPR